MTNFLLSVVSCLTLLPSIALSGDCGRLCYPSFWKSPHPSNYDIGSVINKGADANAIDINGRSPILVALEFGSFENVQELINLGASLEAIDLKNNTPLHYAASRGNLKILDLLIDNGGDISALNDELQTPLHHANEDKVVQRLFDMGADINAADVNGYTPIFHVTGYAFGGGSPVAVRKLIKLGANIEATAANGLTPLHTAAISANLEIIRMLIDAGASINIRDREGNTPLHLAEKYDVTGCIGRPDAVTLLINLGADNSIKNKFGQTYREVEEPGWIC